MKLNYNSPNAKLYRWFYNVSEEYNMPSNKCNLIFRCIIMYIFFLPLFAFCIPGIIAGLIAGNTHLISKDEDLEQENIIAVAATSKNAFLIFLIT